MIDITKFGKVVDAHCDECFNEALNQAWENGPPYWLKQDEDGDFVTTYCNDYCLWLGEHRQMQRCLVVDNVCDFGRDNIFTLCPTHLAALAEQVRNG